MMQTIVLEDNYNQTPIDQYLCICGDPVEGFCHYLLACLFYSASRKKFLSTILTNLTNLDPSTEREQIIFLLADVVSGVSYKVALFTFAASKIQATLASI